MGNHMEKHGKYKAHKLQGNGNIWKKKGTRCSESKDAAKQDIVGSTWWRAYEELGKTHGENCSGQQGENIPNEKIIGIYSDKQIENH